MATVVGTIKFPKWDDYPRGIEGTNKYFEDADKKLDELYEASNNLPKDVIVGKMIHFPVADGSAIYQVVKEKPLQLKHVPYCDAWHADRILIRGLRKADILQRFG